MAEPIARQLAAFIGDCSIGSLPPAVVERTKHYVLDTIGAMVAGADEKSTRIIADLVSTLGGNATCSVIGSASRASMTGAALVNGAMGHAVEIDDDHRTSALHPGVAVVPAALAMAEARGASGSAFLEGVVAGYEVVTRIGDAFQGVQDSCGFHSTGTCGVFGAAAAAGRIAGLDTAQLTFALGIAGSQASGLQEWKSDGSWTKRLHAGKAAEAGVISALLAEQGYTGPDTVLEGPYGFLKAYSFGQVEDANEITRDLGEQFRGSATSFKPYACCRFSHQIIDAVLHLVESHKIGADDIERCTVRIYASGYKALFEPLARRVRPTNIVDAQFSAPYIVASSILYGPPLPPHFTEDAIRDRAVIDLASRVEGIPDDEYEKTFPDRYQTTVSIHLKCGKVVSQFEEIASGDPDKPTYSEQPGRFEDEITRKFHALLETSPAFRDKAGLIVREIHRLEKLENVSALSQYLTTQ